jgi:hypothetical protein
MYYTEYRNREIDIASRTGKAVWVIPGIRPVG